MKCSHILVLAALSATAMTSGTNLHARAQSDAVSSAQSAPDSDATAFDEGTPVPVAREVSLPASVRRTLARGAKTVFCVAANMDGRSVLLHGWNTIKGDTTLDILSTTATRSPSRSRKRTRRRTASPGRLKRMAIGRIEPGQVVVRVAPLKVGGRGSVVALKWWPEEHTAGAFMTVPMIALVWPNGVGNSAMTQDFSTESSAGGNTFYTFCTAQNGEAFMLLREESFDAGSQSLQRFVWNGRKFERQGEGVTKPLAKSD